MQAANDQTARVILNILKKIIVHQFHNTSYTARMRGTWKVDDCQWLKEDAANIAPVLLRLRTDNPLCYQRIVEALRLMLPFFADFVLEPSHNEVTSHNEVILCWRERNSDLVFSAAQASDGMLRAIALARCFCSHTRTCPMCSFSTNLNWASTLTQSTWSGI